MKQAEDQVRLVRQNLMKAKSPQISYADNRRRSLIFEAGDQVNLRLTHQRSAKVWY